MSAQLNIIGWSPDEMAERCARDIPDTAIVNLGIGMPERVASFLPEDREILYHTENGLLGMGPPPAPGEEDRNLINAGKRHITTVPGAAYFHHADSFAMIRGGHVDFCVLGAMQIAENGDIANWSTGAPGAIPAVGGAMDLVVGAKRIFAITKHCTKNGAPKLVQRCSLPLTGKGAVNRIYTDLAVLEVSGEKFNLVECAPGVTAGDVRSNTDAEIVV
ncbi:CoA transferase subunit B [Parasphingopyxis algicola]|uniref:3-oxoacid CoA-transferase subunit B n=1 Tax=Parasphingopyxis algicola TaxID=2026624 RepID=UPI00159F9181|nr:3-oxoacid CoA-transferase subunit B [Parasphingopyxis algicola]QLC24930.1 CoA transferase subunit B [Parasphingopyxis algicola]